MGIRAAAVARKKTLPPRVPIATVLVRETAGAVRRLYPGIRDLHLVGSRLRHKYARDLDWVAVVSRPGDMPGRNVTLKIGALSVNLFFALPEERETTVLEFGLGLDIRRWKRRAIDRGFKLNRYGLFHKGVKMTGRLVEIAGVLGLAPKPALVWTLKNPFYEATMLPMTCPGCRGMDFRITFAGEQIIPPEGPAVLTCSGCGNVFWGRLSIVGGCRRDGYPGEEDAA